LLPKYSANVLALGGEVSLVLHEYFLLILKH
jgi:hypothetical protein